MADTVELNLPKKKWEDVLPPRVCAFQGKWAYQRITPDNFTAMAADFADLVPEEQAVFNLFQLSMMVQRR